jgi:hypothetical protein
MANAQVLETARDTTNIVLSLTGIAQLWKAWRSLQMVGAIEAALSGGSAALLAEDAANLTHAFHAFDRWDRILFNQRTTGALVGVTPQGELGVMVAAGEKAALTPDQAAFVRSMGWVPITAKGFHAEQTLLRSAFELEWQPLALSTSRPACPACFFGLNELGWASVGRGTWTSGP